MKICLFVSIARRNGKHRIGNYYTIGSNYPLVIVYTCVWAFKCHLFYQMTQVTPKWCGAFSWVLNHKINHSGIRFHHASNGNHIYFTVNHCSFHIQQKRSQESAILSYNCSLRNMQMLLHFAAYVYANNSCECQLFVMCLFTMNLLDALNTLCLM